MIKYVQTISCLKLNMFFSWTELLETTVQPSEVFLHKMAFNHGRT